MQLLSLSLFVAGLPGLVHGWSAVNMTIFAQRGCVPGNIRGIANIAFIPASISMDNCYDVRDIGSLWYDDANANDCSVRMYPEWGCRGDSGDFDIHANTCNDDEFSSVRVSCVSGSLSKSHAAEVWSRINGGAPPAAVDFPQDE